MNLRHNRTSFNENEIFYNKFHFTLKKVTAQVPSRRAPIKFFVIDKVNENFKHEYQLRTVKYIFTSEELNNNEIFCNYNVQRYNIETNDVLYAFKINPMDEQFYAQWCKSVDEINCIVLNEQFKEFKFTFVSFTTYQMLIQQDYIERWDNRTINRCPFKTVRQEWDIENPCENCKFVFLKSQNAAFRKKCCANGLFMKIELPKNLSYFCNIDNELFIKNGYIYNNLLAFGSLGVDKTYDSNYIRTQGGSVTLQGRTYLLHRRENSTKALVFFTNGFKKDDESDRIFTDVQNVVKQYNMNGDQSQNCENHIYILNTLRNEQYFVNQLVRQYNTIMENMKEMEFGQLKFELSNTAISVYDVSHYRTGENGDPAMHVWLKDSVNSHVIKATNSLYETVKINFTKLHNKHK